MSSRMLFVVQSLSGVQFFTTPWTAARQASLFFTISWSLLKFMSIELVIPSNHLILCRPFLLLPSIFPSIKVFSNELALGIRWPKYWNIRQNTVVMKDLMFAGREILFCIFLCLTRTVETTQPLAFNIEIAKVLEGLKVQRGERMLPRYQ